jgi:transposase
MPRSLTVRRPRLVEIRRPPQLLEGELRAWQRRRAEIILLSAAGLNATDIVAVLEVHVHTVDADLHAFEREGLASIHQRWCLGALPRLTAEQQVAIGRLAEGPPSELGLPSGRWSLAKRRAYLIRRRLVKRISREHLRRGLEKGDSASAASSRN